ncbi:MAG: SpoIIE family protein phosphatase [bacterium]
MAENRIVLIVEDEGGESSELKRIECPSGWTARHAESVAEALEILKTDKPSMVISDIPSSLLTDEYAEMVAQLPEIAVVRVLPEEDAHVILGCFRAGLYDVLVKPVTREKTDRLFARFEDFTSLIAKTRIYQDKLEKANTELNESLRILELDQKAGRQVQQNLLPDTPQRRGEYEIAYQITPSLYLSGDFVGYNIVFDRYLLFYLADVSGHGASSAFITVLLRFFLNRIVRKHIHEQDHKALARAPEGFIEHVNRQLIDMNIDKHLTMFAGAIDTEKNILRYSVAAHMPTPIFKTGDDARFIPGKGRPVGIFPNAEWEVEEVYLPEKFLLVATSDGILEFIAGQSLQDKLNSMIGAVSKSDGSLESLSDNFGVPDVENVPDDVTILTVSRGY